MGLLTGYGEGYIRPPMGNSIKLPTKTEIREADGGGQGHFRVVGQFDWQEISNKNPAQTRYTSRAGPNTKWRMSGWYRLCPTP
jgi:hypothetical protein